MIKNHPYFMQSSNEQRRFMVKLSIISITINLILGGLSVFLHLYFLPLVFISITLTIVAPFYDVPELVRKGRLKYYSLLFLAEKREEDEIKIHGGTLFDYYFVIDKKMNGMQRTRFVISEYLKGLLNLIESEKENTLIQGTSYIINERTAQKVGLQKRRTNELQKLILIFNFFNILLSLLLVKKKLIFPKLNHINTYEAKISDIKKNKPMLLKLLERTK